MKSRMLFGQLILVVVIIIVPGLQRAAAQESINTSGGNATGGGGSVSFSIGQLVTSTATGTDGSIAEGVQVPYEISVATIVDRAPGITLAARVYPNPAADILTLDLGKLATDDAWYILYDIQGSQHLRQRITSPLMQIDMAGLKSGTYLLKITISNSEIKIFKIIKK